MKTKRSCPTTWGHPRHEHRQTASINCKYFQLLLRVYNYSNSIHLKERDTPPVTLWYLFRIYNFFKERDIPPETLWYLFCIYNFLKERDTPPVQHFLLFYDILKWFYDFYSQLSFLNPEDNLDDKFATFRLLYIFFFVNFLQPRFKEKSEVLSNFVC